MYATPVLLPMRAWNKSWSLCIELEEAFDRLQRVPQSRAVCLESFLTTQQLSYQILKTLKVIRLIEKFFEQLGIEVVHCLRWKTYFVCRLYGFLPDVLKLKFCEW